MDRNQRPPTFKETKKYLKRKGRDCPYEDCSGKTSRGELELDGNVIFCDMTCQICGRSWTDEYVLDGVTDTKAEDEPEQCPTCGSLEKMPMMERHVNEQSNRKELVYICYNCDTAHKPMIEGEKIR